MDRTDIETRIKQAAQSTDTLIARLDTLTNRIDTAKSNQNGELVEYYENQFAEASAEFMIGVESILDDWYMLKGEKRPPAAEETIGPEMLEEIHDAVVGIVQGLSDQATPAANPARPADARDDVAMPPSSSDRGKRPGNKVDLTG